MAQAVIQPRRGHRGVTLIELMVVVLIIALLATVGMVTLKNTRGKARDAKRVYDVQQYAKALRLYADEHEGNFPVTNGFLGTARNDAVNAEIKKYIPSEPSDPLDRGGSGALDYYYYYVAANTCAGETVPTVHAQRIESNTAEYNQNPCSGESNTGNADVAEYLVIVR